MRLNAPRRNLYSTTDKPTPDLGARPEGPTEPTGTHFLKQGRYWAVLDPDQQLVCLAVYKKGAQEVVHRLNHTPRKETIAMAYATQLTLGTSNKVSVDYQSQEVHLSLTYQLEREDTNLLRIVEEKACEVERAHRAVWRKIRQLQAEQKANETPEQKPMASPPHSETPKGSDNSPTAAPTSRASPSNHHGTLPDGSAPPGTPSPETAATLAQQRALHSLTRRAGLTPEALCRQLQQRFGKASLEELTQQEAASLLLERQRTEKAKTQKATPEKA